MKVDFKLREGVFNNLRTACTTGNNIKVNKAVQQAITKFQKGTHIKEDAVLPQGVEVEGAKPKKS